MKKNYGLVVGDEVRVKGNVFGCGKINKILPLGSYDKSYRLAEVLWSSDWYMKVGLVKVFALRDLTKRVEI